MFDRKEHFKLEELDYYQLYKSRCSELKNMMSYEMDYKEYSDFSNFQDIFTEEEFKTALRVKHRRSSKRTRTKSKLRDMIAYINFFKRFPIDGGYCDKYLVFGTCTFNDKVLSRESRTRDKLLNKYLLTYYDAVILNKDFGSKNEREHYHFIGISKAKPLPHLKNDGTQFRSKKGFPLFIQSNDSYSLGHKPVLEIIDLDNIDKMKNYLLKLNNHSNKTTTARQRIRYLKSKNYSAFLKLLDNMKRHN